MNRFIATIGAKPLCPVHGHMVYFVSNRVYVLVRSLETNVLPGLSTCVSVLAGGQQSTLEVEHYLIGSLPLYCKLVCPCLLVRRRQILCRNTMHKISGLSPGSPTDRFRRHVGLTTTVWRFPDTGTPLVVKVSVLLYCFWLRSKLGIVGSVSGLNMCCLWTQG